MAAEASAGRRRDGKASRDALLTAARELFAARGYDHTTVRAIAERAGLNQALLFRYFGSKRELFAEAVVGDLPRHLDETRPDELLNETIDRMLAGGASDHLLYAVLRSPGQDTALDAIREAVGDRYRSVFSGLAGTGDRSDADLRADLLLSWLLGIGFARHVLRSPPLVDSAPAEIAEHVRRAAHALLEDEPR